MSRPIQSRDLASRCKKTLTNQSKLQSIFVDSVKDDFIESSKTTIDGFQKSPDVISMKKIKSSKEYGSIVASFFGDDDRSDVDQTIHKLNMAEENYKRRNRHLHNNDLFFPQSSFPASSSTLDSYYCEDDEEQQAELVVLFDKLSTDESE